MGFRTSDEYLLEVRTLLSKVSLDDIRRGRPLWKLPVTTEVAVAPTHSSHQPEPTPTIWRRLWGSPKEKK